MRHRHRKKFDRGKFDRGDISVEKPGWNPHMWCNRASHFFGRVEEKAATTMPNVKTTFGFQKANWPVEADGKTLKANPRLKNGKWVLAKDGVTLIKGPGGKNVSQHQWDNYRQEQHDANRRVGGKQTTTPKSAGAKKKKRAGATKAATATPPGRKNPERTVKKKPSSVPKHVGHELTHPQSPHSPTGVGDGGAQEPGMEVDSMDEKQKEGSVHGPEMTRDAMAGGDGGGGGGGGDSAEHSAKNQSSTSAVGPEVGAEEHQAAAAGAHGVSASTNPEAEESKNPDSK